MEDDVHEGETRQKRGAKRYERNGNNKSQTASTLVCRLYRLKANAQCEYYEIFICAVISNELSYRLQTTQYYTNENCRAFYSHLHRADGAARDVNRNT